MTSQTPNSAQRDQYTMVDPTKLYADIEPQAISQDGPGLDSGLRDKADLGEGSYRGAGRLTGRKALITGGDSGIGAATAIAFAREGADVAIFYLPEEQSDADRIRGLIEDAGQKAVLPPGDLTDRTYCADIVTKTVDQLGGLDILVCNGGKQRHVEKLEDLTVEQLTRPSRPMSMRCSSRSRRHCRTCPPDRASSQPPRSRRTSRRRTSSTTRRPRRPSTPSARDSHSNSPRAGSG